jgi:hypothetical protein
MARKKKLVSVPQVVDVNLDYVAEALVHEGFDEVIKFIKKLDLMCEDWGVTSELYQHFEKEMRKCPPDEA